MARVATAALDSRLSDWAHEYGGSRYEDLGFSTGEHILAKLVKFGGYMPSSGGPVAMPSLTPADEVERVVRRMAQCWPSHAMVLRCDYFYPGQAMDARLDWLRHKGHKLGRAGYYTRLESAKLYVAGALI